MMEPKRILYFRDARFPDALRKRLEGRGYELDSVTSGSELYERSALERPALIIAFAQMPGLDGLALCRQIKENLSLKEIPVFVFSPKKGNTRQQYYAVGCDGYYEAPFDDVSITQRVDELIHDRSGARRLSMARLAIDYLVNPDVLVLSAAELQEGMLFLRSNNPLDVGSRLKLTLSVAAKTLLDAHGEVIRSEPFRGFGARPAGMAIRLYDMDEASQWFLDALTRQALLAGKGWEEPHVEALVDRIASDLGSGAAPGPEEVMLRRAGYDRERLRPWERAAFEGDEDEGDLEVVGALREAVGLVHKLNYHLGRYRELVYVTPGAIARMSAHSEQVLARAEAAGDVLGSLSERLAASGRAEEAQQLVTTQADLLQRMVELRTAMSDARQSAEAAAPAARDDLFADPEVRSLCLGISELLDLGSGGAHRPGARALPPELDLSELSHFEIVSYMEAGQAATTIHPDVATWARTLAAWHVHIHEFLRYRKPGREIRPDRIEEVLTFSRRAIDAVLGLQDRFRADLQRLSKASSVPRGHLEELSATDWRLLHAAARLSAYASRHTPRGTPDEGPRLKEAADAVARLVPPAGGGGPFPTSPSPGVVEEVPPAPEGAPPPPGDRAAARAEPRFGRVREWIEAFGPRRLALIALAVVVLAGGGLGAYLALSPSEPGGAERVDVRPFAGILPLARCEVRRSPGQEKEVRTLRCIVQGEWLKRPKPERKESLAELVSAVRAKRIADQVLLIDASDYTVGVAAEADVEVYDR
jgi:CheY-like chemotaxis protein